MTITRQIDVGMSVPPTALDLCARVRFACLHGNAVESQRNVSPRHHRHGDFVKNRRAVAPNPDVCCTTASIYFMPNRDEAADVRDANHIDSDIAPLLGLLSPDKMIVEADWLPCGRREAVTDKFHFHEADRAESSRPLSTCLYGRASKGELIKGNNVNGRSA